MEAQYLDHYSYLDSPVHRLGAHTKLALAVGMVFLILLIPISWAWFHIGVWALLIMATISSRLPIGGVIKRLRWILLAVLMLSVGRIWQPDGWLYFLSTLLKSSECLVIMVLLSNTTRFSELLQVIAALQAPQVLVTTLSLMYRYLFVLSDERNRMLRARRSRTFTRSKWNIWQTQSNIITLLFVRCAERAGRIHAAMCSRGMQ